MCADIWGLFEGPYEITYLVISACITINKYNAIGYINTRRPPKEE